MEKLEMLVCSWQQGKQLVGLNVNEKSLFKWVHPFQFYTFIENKRKYILVESHKIANRSSYPAYTLEELLQLLPNDYIIGRCDDSWFCMSDYDLTSTITYELTAIDACFNALVMLALRDMKKACYAHSERYE